MICYFVIFMTFLLAFSQVVLISAVHVERKYIQKFRGYHDNVEVLSTSGSKSGGMLNDLASFTYYYSFPFCCPNSPNYDPNADKTECRDNSGCKYIGNLEALGNVSLDFVKSNNLVAFYDNSDPNGDNFDINYANKTIQITKTFDGNTYIFNATIADTCNNADCHNCCAKNSKPYGYLVDMEYYTLVNNFGNVDAAKGSLSFVIYGTDAESGSGSYNGALRIKMSFGVSIGCVILMIVLLICA